MSDIGKSITQFIIEQQRTHSQSTGEFSGLMNDVAQGAICTMVLTYGGSGIPGGYP